MPSFNILKSSNINRTPRVMQVEGIFDVMPSKTSEVAWSGDFDFPEDWQIGAIVGLSGSGKSTVAREIFGDCLIDGFDWPNDKSILDGFQDNLSIKIITDALSSVGFSSPGVGLSVAIANE